MPKLVHNVQKKQHRERSQTSSRGRFGLLEKKKDYKLRAADYHKKQAALKALKNKIQNYNEDEYYHAMTRKRTDEKGILISDRDNETLSTEQVKLLKTQDANYVRTMRLKEVAQIEKQKEEVYFRSQGKHTVFVGSHEEQKNFVPEKYFQTDKSILNRRENRIRLDQLEVNDRIVNTNGIDSLEMEKRNVKKLKQLKALEKKIDRASQLQQVEDRMNFTKELMKKGSKKKVFTVDGKTSFKWKNQRKR